MQTKGNSLRRYHSYLLRIWCEDDMLAWRFQLEDPNTHEVIGFQNMEKLLCFLNEQVFHSDGSIT
ncbi:MAG TPA: hypothetical protein PLG52_06495 [Anaerolineales bacterium]|nr:hypothetical protein [Anaerolineales bacterium]